LGLCESPLFIDDPLGFIQDPVARLAWINDKARYFRPYSLKESFQSNSVLK
jgi:hypothetical protein